MFLTTHTFVYLGIIERRARKKEKGGKRVARKRALQKKEGAFKKITRLFFMERAPVGVLGTYPPYRVLLGPQGPLGPYPAYGGPAGAVRFKKISALLEHFITS